MVTHTREGITPQPKKGAVATTDGFYKEYKHGTLAWPVINLKRGGEEKISTSMCLPVLPAVFVLGMTTANPRTGNKNNNAGHDIHFGHSGVPTTGAPPSPMRLIAQQLPRIIVDGMSIFGLPLSMLEIAAWDTIQALTADSDYQAADREQKREMAAYMLCRGLTAGEATQSAEQRTPLFPSLLHCLGGAVVLTIEAGERIRDRRVE